MTVDVFLIWADPSELVGFDAEAARRVSCRGQGLVDQIAAILILTPAVIKSLPTGGRHGMVLACELAIASTKARFIRLQSSVGLIPRSWENHSRPRRIGFARANWTNFIVALLYAGVALAWEIVNEVAQPNQIRSRAWAIGRQIAINYGRVLRSANAPITRRALRELCGDKRTSNPLRCTERGGCEGGYGERAF